VPAKYSRACGEVDKGKEMKWELPKQEGTQIYSKIKFNNWL